MAVASRWFVACLLSAVAVSSGFAGGKHLRSAARDVLDRHVGVQLSYDIGDACLASFDAERVVQRCLSAAGIVARSLAESDKHGDDDACPQLAFGIEEERDPALSRDQRLFVIHLILTTQASADGTQPPQLQFARSKAVVVPRGKLRRCLSSDPDVLRAFEKGVPSLVEVLRKAWAGPVSLAHAP